MPYSRKPAKGGVRRTARTTGDLRGGPITGHERSDRREHGNFKRSFQGDWGRWTGDAGRGMVGLPGDVEPYHCGA